MAKNVFQELQEEREQEFAEVQKVVKKNIQKRRGFWALIGDIIELYVPSVFTTLSGTLNSALPESKSDDPLKSLN